MEAVRLNRTGNRQNIDLPETMNFADDDLCAAKIGDAVIIMPRKSIRAIMRQGLNGFTPDCFADGRGPFVSKSAPETN
ncbi:MAG: AbrB/MazE/SpoVT family DNA-binding domain-containing protein [Clostridia bacterium]|nr:AbrB/MazE/SpoVT family DNA-binding domain-containing protein [Clostridia bacterium]